MSATLQPGDRRVSICRRTRLYFFKTRLSVGGWCRGEVARCERCNVFEKVLVLLTVSGARL